MATRCVSTVRVLMATLAALSVAVIVSATATRGVSPANNDWKAVSPGSVAADEGILDCSNHTHSHGSYKHEKRATAGGGPGTIYEWHTVRPTEVEWESTEVICP